MVGLLIKESKLKELIHGKILNLNTEDICLWQENAQELPEVRMCQQIFKINFEKITSLCLNKKMKAYLNENLKLKSIRYPDNVDRNKCRENLLTAITKKNIAGKQLFPHELVDKVVYDISSGVKAVINSQWESMKSNVLDMINERKKQTLEDNESLKMDFGKIVFMADTSGSMAGIPLSVAVGISI